MFHFAFVSAMPIRCNSLLHKNASSRVCEGLPVRKRRIMSSSLQPPPRLPPSETKSSHASLIRRPITNLLPLALVPLLLAFPVLAATGAYFPNPIAAPLDPKSFISGLTASFALVLASEIGDKTFFISALMSMKHSKVLVLLGTMLALGAMTIISVLIGQIFHALPPSLNTSIPFDDYAAIALLLWFGFQSIKDGLSMKSNDDGELQDAKEVVDGRAGINEESGVKVVAQTSSLIFLAEWGDKSMLATVALAAAKNPWGVIAGGISGHFIASIIAVVGGSFFGKFISEKSARIFGGVLFLVFAFLTIFGIY